MVLMVPVGVVKNLQVREGSRKALGRISEGSQIADETKKSAFFPTLVLYGADGARRGGEGSRKGLA
jgi:hypothetical protein